MPISSLSKERIRSLENILQGSKTEFEYLQQASPQDLYAADLDELEMHLAHLKCDHEQQIE